MNKKEELKSNNEPVFKPLSFWRELLLKEDELVEYYNNKRKYEYENNIPIKGMKIRDILHPILLKLIKLNRKLFTKQTITVLNDPRKKSDKPVIYAITHVGMYDYQIVCEVINEHQYAFAGDPETMYRSSDGLILSLNGLIYCDTDSKEDRNIAAERAKEVLKRGTSLAIYPEGIWNVTPNLLSLPLYPGIIKMAMDTDCEIVPVAVEQYGDDFFVNIGENIKVSTNKLFESEEEKKSYINVQKEKLRDVFATLKWEILENGPKLCRKEMGTYEEEYHKFVRTRLDEWINKKDNKPYYTEEKVEERTFRPRGITFFKEAFSHLGKLKLNKSNAFLFRKTNDLSKELANKMQENLNNENKKVR